MKDRVLHTPNSNQSSSKTLRGRRGGLGWRELTAEGSLLAAFPVTWIVRPLFLKGNSWHPYHGICHTATFWICHWNYAGLISHSSHLAYCLIFHHQSGTPWSKPSGSLLPTEKKNLLIITYHLPSACLIIWQAIWLAHPIFHPTWDSFLLLYLPKSYSLRLVQMLPFSFASASIQVPITFYPEWLVSWVNQCYLISLSPSSHSAQQPLSMSACLGSSQFFPVLEDTPRNDWKERF